MKIETANLTLRFGDKDPLFENFDLDISSGDFLLIQGPSGSGKSSILRLFNRLIEPTSGQLRFDGQPIADAEVPALRRRIAYVQQTPVVVPGSVRENLEYSFTFKVAAKEPKPSAETLRRWLDDFLLDDVDLNDDASTLSVGQQQRIAFIRILLVQPDFLLCDEPTSALDQQSREIVENWLEKINLEQRIGILLVTHLDFIPKQVTPRRFLLEEGVLKEVTA